jgi:hypothetical protein
MRRIAAPLASAALLLAAGCGGSGQNRPGVVAVFPANGQVLPGPLGCIRVTYDEPVHVLSEHAVRVAADAVDEGGVPVRLLPDPEDPFSVLVLPVFGGHFFPGEEHHLVVQEGAVVNDDGRYALDDFDSFFTVGPASNLFVTTTTGAVYEIDPASGTQVNATAPPAGFVAHDPIGGDDRVFVWLDPSPGPGASALGTFVPGDAAIVQTIPLSGETGAPQGSKLVLDPAGHDLYATARDPGTGRLFVHRVDLASLTETGSLMLSPTLTGAEPDFQPSLDLERRRLYVPFDAGGGAGLLAIVDLDTFTEVDAGPVPGVDALPMPDGAGDSTYEWTRDAVFVLLEDETAPGFVILDPEDLAQAAGREPSLVGAPEALFATPDARWLVQGLSGYAGQDALVRTDAGEWDEGFAVGLSDDVGAGPEGSTRVSAFLRHPTAERVFAFADDGVDTVLALYDFDDGGFFQVDLDAGTAGVQSFDLSSSAPGVATGATTLFGACGP